MPDRWNRFRLDEISVVPRGAQPGADITIEKGADDVNEHEKNDLVDLFTSTNMGHNHGVRVAVENQSLNFYVYFSEMTDTSGQDTRHDHQVIRTESGDFQLSEQFGHSHTIAAADVESAIMRAVNKGAKLPEGIKVADLMAGFKQSDKPDGDNSMNEADKKALEDKIAETQAENKTLKAVSELPTEQKAHYDSLDETGKATFLAKSAEDKAKDVKAASAATDVVFTDVEGKEYKRGDVTDTELDLLKKFDALQRENAELKAKDADRTAESKVKELSHLPGTDAEKLEMVKAIEAIPNTEQREKAFNVLKANGASPSMFVKTGLDTEGEDFVDTSSSKASQDTFDALVKKEMDANPNLKKSDAIQRVMKSHPEVATSAIAG